MRLKKTVVILLIIFIFYNLSSVIYVWAYKKYIPLKRIDGTKDYYSPKKKFKAVRYLLPNFYTYFIGGLPYTKVGSFERIINVQTGETLGDIKHEEFFYYEFIDDKFCIGSKVYYREGWFGNKEIDEDKRCIFLE